MRSRKGIVIEGITIRGREGSGMSTPRETWRKDGGSEILKVRRTEDENVRKRVPMADHLEERFQYELFTAEACTMSNTLSPTPRNFSATERIVGSGMADASGLWHA